MQSVYEAESAQELAELQRKAKGGDAESQFDLGGCHSNGYVVEQDLVRALELFEKAAAQGHPGGQCMRGFYHEYGFGGVKKDAEQWYVQCVETSPHLASEGDAVGQHIGSCSATTGE